MNPKVQLEKLSKDLQWMIYQSVLTKQSFSAITAVSEVYKKTNALSTYGDYFPYTQNRMIADVQLQLSKLYDGNNNSISLHKIIKVANDLFTENYYKETGFNANKTYDELKSELDSLNMKLNELSNAIANLKVLRDKNLAHLDKKVQSVEKLEEIINANPIYLADTMKLIDFSINCLITIEGIIFNVHKKIINKDYTKGLEQIAKAIEFYTEYEEKKISDELAVHFVEKDA